MLWNWFLLHSITTNWRAQSNFKSTLFTWFCAFFPETNLQDYKFIHKLFHFQDLTDLPLRLSYISYKFGKFWEFGLVGEFPGPVAFLQDFPVLENTTVKLSGPGCSQGG